MINLMDVVEQLDLTEAEILKLISDCDRLERLYQDDNKRLTTLIYEYEALLSERNRLQKDKSKLEEQAQHDYDKMRLQLMLENAELKNRLYDELLRAADQPQQKPVINLADYSA